MKQRKDVYKLPAGDKTLDWYAKAVIEMKKRPTTDPTSWNYQAAIHGINPSSPFWAGSQPYPGNPEQQQYWNKCQHSSWYFLPWHRMYLAYFEQIVAQTIVGLGGPPDWALPFWNYSETVSARTMPPAFTHPADKTNGLWITGRNSNLTMPANDVALTNLGIIPFTGDGKTSPLGFGGPQTPFNHGGGGYPFGGLEKLPHNPIHVDIGGAMGVPSTAALDPIFWLHHANIDRLWQVWLNMGGGRANPTISAWTDATFDFHDKDRKPVTMACRDVEDTTKVLTGYTYEGVPTSRPSLLENVALLSKADFSMPLEVAGAVTGSALTSVKTVVPLPLHPSPRKIMNFKAFTESLDGPPKPKTAVLHFENITGKGVPPVQNVYLNVPEGDGNKETYYAGSISFFGLEEASTASEHQSGSGLHDTLDVSELVDKLRGLPNWNEQKLSISIEPASDMDKNSSVTIGRISLYTE